MVVIITPCATSGPDTADWIQRQRWGSHCTKNPHRGRGSEKPERQQGGGGLLSLKNSMGDDRPRSTEQGSIERR